MRFTSIDIEAFGGLKSWRVDGLHPRLVVVYGPNEAGKSTLFRFLTYMLYGIYPADPQLNPYVPWDGGVLAGGAQVALQDGTRLRVHRRLLSQPRGVVEYLPGEPGAPGGAADRPGGAAPAEGRVEELRNRALPGTSHIPQKIFEDVYALTADQLRFPADDAWALIHDRLLGHLGSDAFRPMHKVLEELQEEADRIWRPNRRGKQRAREIAAQLEGLREKRREAARRDEAIRAGYERLHQLRDQAARLRAEEVAWEARRRKATRLAPVRQTLRRIEALEAQAGDLSPWRDVPEDPRAALDSLAQAIAGHRQSLEELDRQIEAQRRHIAAFTPGDEAVLQREGEILGSTASLRQLEDARTRLDALQRQLERQEGQLQEQTRDLLRTPWHPDLEGPLDQLPLNELRARLQQYRTADAAFQEARHRTLAFESQEGPGPEKVSSGWAVAAMAAGLALAFIGGSAVIDLLLWAGVLLTLLGAVQWWSRRQERHRLRQEEARRRRQGAQLRAGEAEAAQARDKALQQVEKLLSPLPILEIRLEMPDETLLIDLQNAQAAVRSLRKTREEIGALQREVARGTAQLQQVLAEVAAATAQATLAPVEPVPVPDAPPPGVPLPGSPEGPMGQLDLAGLDLAGLAREAGKLPPLLEEIRERRHRAQSARQLLLRLREERDKVQAALTALQQQRDAIYQALALIGPRPGGNPAPGAPAGAVEQPAGWAPAELDARIGQLLARRKAARDAEALRENLVRNYPDLEQLMEEIAAAEREAPGGEDGWSFSDEAIIGMERKLDGLKGQIAEVEREAARLEEQLRHMENGATLDQVDGEIAALEEERRRLLRKRDRLALLSRVLQEADRRFRDEHQPDVLRRAGAYLSTITGGRYVRLFLDQKGAGLQLGLLRADEPFPRAVSFPLSRGTLDQVYLALRLAIVDHLDANQEPLPLFLDEVFINWDAARRGHGFQLLEEVGQRRQVFFFTCHAPLADELAGSLDAGRIDLPAPREGRGGPSSPGAR